ncbi:MAG: hypothetical protein KDB01_00095 [Planctomycetaceae bacterium]|nr:hypothetical protein [Planctomycetaceae bacterium]
MNEDGVRVTRIDWLAVVPSLRLLEAVHLSVSPRVLTPVILLLLAGSAMMQGPGLIFDALRSQNAVSDTPGIFGFESINRAVGAVKIPESPALILTGSFSEFCFSMIALEVWMLVIGFCGVVAVRSAGCRFCTGTGLGLIASTRYTLQHWLAILVSAVLSGILLSLLGVAFRILCLAGALIHPGITAFISLLCVLGCAVLGMGWLLSLAAIAIDRCDGAEALSRGICYVLSRWQRILVYAAGCCLILWLSDLVISAVFTNAHGLTSAMLGKADSAQVGTSLKFFRDAIHLSIFFCGIAIAYVLLRNIEDGVSLREMDGGKQFAS